MIRHETDMPGLFLFELDRFADERGSFMELYRKSRYEEFGLPTTFVQDNLSASKKGVLRGLHGQNPNPQGKLVACLRGEIWDVAVDIRIGSPTYGQWRGFWLSEENRRQLFIPAGCLHGFQVHSDEALVSYKIDGEYDRTGDFAVRWDDPELAVGWPDLDVPRILSTKDAGAPLLSEASNRRIVFEP
jgi:dTDP-4-dehydrorhamnose 3,5-epimerase